METVKLKELKKGVKTVFSINGEVYITLGGNKGKYVECMTAYDTVHNPHNVIYIDNDALVVNEGALCI